MPIYNKNRALIFLILVISFSVPISQQLSIRLIIITAVIALFIGSDRMHLSTLGMQIWDIGIFLIFITLGLIYSENFKTGLGLIETSATLFTIPFILCKFKNFTKENLHQVFYFFSFGLLITSSVCLVNAIVSFLSSRDQQIFFFDNLTGFIGSDPIYFSYYLIFAITFGFYLLYFDQIKKRKGLVVGAIIFFFSMLMLTAGNTAFVSILLVLAFFILKFLTELEITSFKIVVFGLSVIFLIAMFYVSYFGLDSFEGNNYWERFVLWEAAIKAIPNLLIGVGTGDYTSVLNDYYRSHNLNQFSLSNYNAHNQFIQTLLSNGILGLVALLIMMIRPLVLSIRYQNPLGILVFFSFFIYGLTEVFLGRYQGVVFFALMHQSFITYYHSQSKVLAVKES